MLNSLQNANSYASEKVCHQHNDRFARGLYIANMAKRARPVLNVRWYLREWMDTLHVRQSQMVEEAGWSKTTASLLYNCQQDYNPDLVEQAAHALKISPYELLMRPADAMALRGFRENAIKLAAESRVDYTPGPDFTDGFDTKKTAA